MVFKTMCSWHTDRQIDQQKSRVQKKTCKYEQQISAKVQTQFSGERIVSSTKEAGTIGNPGAKKSFGPISHIKCKN